MYEKLIRYEASKSLTISTKKSAFSIHYLCMINYHFFMMKTNSNDKLTEMQLIENEFAEPFKKFLDIPLNASQSSISMTGQPVNTHIRISKQNKDYSKTRYYYTDRKKLLHFTSLRALFSILNEKAIRLYNLNNSDDPNEYTYATKNMDRFYKKIGIPEGKIPELTQTVKNESFIFSCTSTDNLQKKNFWKEYADQGKGVAIEFEIINEPLEWEACYLSKTRYGELENFNDLISEVIQILGKNPSNNYTFNIDQILIFHKDPGLQDEDEIRILCQRPEVRSTMFDAYIFYDICRNSSSIVRYMKLPISIVKPRNYCFCREIERFGNIWSQEDAGSDFYKNLIGFQKQIPLIKITNIYFCQEFPFKGVDFNSFIDEIYRMFNDNLGYVIENLSRNIVKYE